MNKNKTDGLPGDDGSDHSQYPVEDQQFIDNQK